MSRLAAIADRDYAPCPEKPLRTQAAHDGYTCPLYTTAHYGFRVERDTHSTLRPLFLEVLL